jgi:hypothetical protein
MRRLAAGAFLPLVLLGVLSSCGRGTAPEAPAHGSGSAQALAANPGVARVALDARFQAAAGQTIYVPAYSHIATSDDARPFDLAVTLSIRNTDRARPIVVRSVRYHDQAGRLVREYATEAKAIRVAPLAAAEFFIKESDTAGGSSASFLVEWAAEHAVTPPVVETVMIGTASTQGISFTCPGRVVAERSSTRPAPEASARDR